MLQLLRPYKLLIFLVFALGFLSNGASLIFPRLIGEAIDAFDADGLVSRTLVWKFAITIAFVAVLSSCQSLIQIFTSEKVARDLRARISERISHQSCSFITDKDPARLLTNLTSDVDAIKLFVAQAIAGLLSSAVIIVGAGILLVNINWRLALGVLAVVPLIGLTFAFVLVRVRKLFKESREVVDRLNTVIKESILGAALIRVLNRTANEMEKFDTVNLRSHAINLGILAHFAAMIPVVVFVANMGTLVILLLGGRFVLDETMTLGEIASFYSYLGLLIFPIFVIGFMSSIIAQARAAYERVAEVLDAPDGAAEGTVEAALLGKLDVRDLDLSFGDTKVLSGINFGIKPRTRNAIVGPTAAGKTQLLYLLMGLSELESGQIEYDGQYRAWELKSQVAMVFQESALFHASLRDNIAFHPSVTEEGMELAIQTAELSDFVKSLPQGLDTLVSERGTTLSGGQKQRVMLARALASNPDILFLDDFTARLDAETEKRVLENLKRNYPKLTLLAVTQRIATIQDYDHILLMMEGEILDRGTHLELMESSTDYQQIYDSQKSTHHYE